MSISFNHIKPKDLCPRPGANHSECHSCIQAHWCRLGTRTMADIVGMSIWITNMKNRDHQERFIIAIARMIMQRSADKGGA